MTNEEFYYIYEDIYYKRVKTIKSKKNEIENINGVFVNWIHETHDSLLYALERSSTLRSFNLETPLPPLEKGLMVNELNFLKEKYQFKILDSCDLSHLSQIYFESRAIISEKDPETNTSFEVDLGIFKTHIEVNKLLSNPYNNLGVSVKSICVKDSQPRSVSGYNCYHPHISASGTLCLGTYKNTIVADFVNFNILSVFQNLCGLLNRYNANSLNFPGAYINLWIGHKCAVCTEFVANGIKCEKTGSFIHEKCGEVVDGKIYSQLEIKKCTQCSKLTPRGVTISKGNILCPLCMKEVVNV